MRKLLFIVFLLLSLTQSVSAETYNTENNKLTMIITDIYEQLAEDDNDIDYEQLATSLLDLSDNPINLNTADEQELRRLFFLNEQQIDAILLFVYKQPLHDLCELRLIDCLADYEVRNMLPFVKVECENTQKQKTFYWQDLWHYAKQEMNIRFDARNIENNTPDPFYTYLKYRFKYRDKIDVGLTAERDPSEPLYYPKKTYGADFYGGWFQINDIGKLHTLTLGDFRASFGHGLVLNTDISYGGKIAYLHNTGFAKYGLRGKTSNSEYNFFRGVGTTIRLGKIDLTMLYSARKIDGRVEDGKFTSIQQTGYHRTESELSAKRAVWQQVMGVNATLRLNKARIGITATENILGDTLIPRRTYYNANYFTGVRQASAGFNYDWRFWRMQLFGEIATTQNTRWGFANMMGVRYVPLSGLTLTTIYRYYSQYYDNLLASGFAETSRTNDEQGIYIGLDMQMFRKVRFSLYGDYFYFSGPKYGIRTSGSSGMDICGILDYQPTEQIGMQLKARTKLKADKDKYSLRYILNINLRNFNLKTALEGNMVSDSSLTFGGMIYQQVDYFVNQVPIVVQCRIEAFYAKNYNNRMYAYENDVLYTYSVPMIYGTGCRWYLNLRYKINSNVSLYLKAAESILFDEIEENTLIKYRTKSEIHSMIRVTW